MKIGQAPFHGNGSKIWGNGSIWKFWKKIFFFRTKISSFPILSEFVNGQWKDNFPFYFVPVKPRRFPFFKFRNTIVSNWHLKIEFKLLYEKFEPEFDNIYLSQLRLIILDESKKLGRFFQIKSIKLDRVFFWSLCNLC